MPARRRIALCTVRACPLGFLPTSISSVWPAERSTETQIRHSGPLWTAPWGDLSDPQGPTGRLFSHVLVWEGRNLLLCRSFPRASGLMDLLTFPSKQICEVFLKSSNILNTMSSKNKTSGNSDIRYGQSGHIPDCNRKRTNSHRPVNRGLPATGSHRERIPRSTAT